MKKIMILTFLVFSFAFVNAQVFSRNLFLRDFDTVKLRPPVSYLNIDNLAVTGSTTVTGDYSFSTDGFTIEYGENWFGLGVKGVGMVIPDDGGWAVNGIFDLTGIGSDTTISSGWMNPAAGKFNVLQADSSGALITVTGSQGLIVTGATTITDGSVVIDTDNDIYAGGQYYAGYIDGDTTMGHYAYQTDYEEYHVGFQIVKDGDFMGSFGVTGYQDGSVEGGIILLDGTMAHTPAIMFGADASSDMIEISSEMVTISGFGFFLPQLSSAPTSPAEGQMYYNTTDHEIHIYNGTDWYTLDMTVVP